MTRHLVKLGNCVLGERDQPRRNGRSFSFGATRLIELEVLLRHRGIERSPNDHLVIVAHHAMNQHAEPKSPMAAAAARRHLLVLARHLAPHQVEEIIDTAVRSLRKWTASALGKALGLSAEERAGLGITTFRYIGQSRADQRAAKRARDRVAAKRRRAARGAIPRCEYIRRSLAEEARRLGISRQALMKRKSRSGLSGPSPSNVSFNGSDEHDNRTLAAGLQPARAAPMSVSQ